MHAWEKGNQFWVRATRGLWLAQGRVDHSCMCKRESILGAGPSGPWLARGGVGQVCMGKSEYILGVGP